MRPSVRTPTLPSGEARRFQPAALKFAHKGRVRTPPPIISKAFFGEDLRRAG